MGNSCVKAEPKRQPSEPVREPELATPIPNTPRNVAPPCMCCYYHYTIVCVVTTTTRLCVLLLLLHDCVCCYYYCTIVCVVTTTTRLCVLTYGSLSNHSGFRFPTAQKVVRALFDYDPQTDDDLAFRKGDRMVLIGNW